MLNMTFLFYLTTESHNGVIQNILDEEAESMEEKIGQVAKDAIKIIDGSQNYPEYKTWPSNGHTKCTFFHLVSEAKRIVSWNVFEAISLKSDGEVTLVTQTSLDRLDRVNLILHNWDGPASLAVHVKPDQKRLLFDKLMKVSYKQLTRLHLVIDLKTTVCLTIFKYNGKFEKCK